MSSRRRVGLSEGKGAVPVDFCLKTFPAHRLLNDIHLTTQNAGQTPFEFAEAAEIIETRGREVFAEAHRYVDIARKILPSCDRTEDGYAQHPCGAKLLFMRFQSGYDVVASHDTNLA